MALNTRQGLEAALADINDLIRLVQSQIASTENSNNFTAAEKAPRLATLRAELAGYRAQQAALTQQLNQLGPNNQSDGATVDAAGPTPVAPGPGTTGTVVAAAAPPTAGAAVYDPNKVYRVDVNGVGNKPVSKEEAASDVKVVVAGVGPKTIQPTPNVLDKLNSYTYQASVYLLTSTQYLNFQAGNRIIPNSQLLFQSGGKAPGTGNKFFDNDFYIDNITLETAIAGKQTQGAHMATDIKFTVTEPMGITLLDRLKNAVAAMQPAVKSNWSAAHYLMTISFFGYDQTGNLTTPGTPALGDVVANPKAVVIKYIPFMLTGVNWTVSNKLVNYEFSGSPIGQITAGSSKNGIIKFDLEITANTVEEFVGGKGANVYTAISPSAADPGQTFRSNSGGGGANAPSNTVAAPTVVEKARGRGGLVYALNLYAGIYKDESKFEIADEYEIVFVNADEIKQSQLKPRPTTVNKTSTQMGATPSTDPNNLVSSKIPVSQDRISISIPAGTPIVKLLDQTIRNSQYITNQMIGYDTPDGDTLTGSSSRTPSWFLITYSATPIGKSIDPIRNDYAYKMRYTITKYSIPNFHSTRFPASNAFPGLHKKYKYWFTGENTSVLDYSANFDSLYNLTVSGFGDKTAQDMIRSQNSASTNDLFRDESFYAIKLGYNPRSVFATGTGEGATNEGSANAAEYLYSPATQGSSRMRIIGDPAWIQQGSLVFPISSDNFQKETDMGFLPDGTISFDAGQVLYEIAWQRPEDYDIGTGLADPYAKTFQKYGDREAIQSNIYQAVKVISEFRGGQFEQTLEGTICIFRKIAPLNNNNYATITETPADNQRTVAQTASVSNRFANAGTAGNTPLPASATSLSAPASNSTGTVPAPVTQMAVQSTNVPGTTAEQFAAVDSSRQAISDVTNIVPSSPPAPVTSNGQTIGGYGFGTVLNSPPVLTAGAGRTSLDALQSAAVNIPPYLTRKDP